MINIRSALNCSNCKHVVAEEDAYGRGRYFCNVTKPLHLSIRGRETEGKPKVSEYQICDLYEAKEQKKP